MSLYLYCISSTIQQDNDKVDMSVIDCLSHLI
jgi:hypothetical protein